MLTDNFRDHMTVVLHVQKYIKLVPTRLPFSYVRTAIPQHPTCHLETTRQPCDRKGGITSRSWTRPRKGPGPRQER